jgi:hypothetical protein
MMLGDMPLSEGYLDGLDQDDTDIPFKTPFTSTSVDAVVQPRTAQEKSYVDQLVAAGITLPTIVAAIAAFRKPPRERVPKPAPVLPMPEPGIGETFKKYSPWIIAGVVGIGLLWYFMKGRKK